MIGGLKEKAQAKAMTSLEEQMAEPLQQNMELFQDLKPSDVQDDGKYGQIVVEPLWAAVKAQSGGAITVAQKFVDVETKFKEGLFNVRDELIVVEGEQVNLHQDFSEKLVPTMIESFK